MDPLCHECPYQRPGQQRIPGSDLHLPKLVVGSFPGISEALGNPPGGLVRQLVNGEAVGWTNVVECFPGSTVDKKALKEAMRCCRPRVEAELAGKDVLVLGNEATEVVHGSKRAITNFRGTVEEDGLAARAVYTVSPTFVERQGGLTTTAGDWIKNDVETWLGRKRGRPEVEILIDPRNLPLPPKGTTLVVDIETTGLDPEKGSPLPPESRPEDVGDEPKIRCYGFAWREVGPRTRANDQPGNGGGVRRAGESHRGRGSDAEGDPRRDEDVHRANGATDGQGSLVVAVFSRLTPYVRKLLDGRYPLVAQNHPFEVKWLEKHCPYFKGAAWSDTVLTAHALHEDRGEENASRAGYRLDALVADFLPWTFPKAEMLEPYNVLTAPLPVLMPYCGWDCVKELLLHERWEDERSTLPTGTPEGVPDVRAAVSARLEHVALPGARFLDRVERRGMPWSADAAGDVAAFLEHERDRFGAFLEEVAEINWNSNDQVIQVFKKLGLKPSGLRTETGQHQLGGLAWAGIRAKNPEYRALVDALVGPDFPARKPMGGYRGALKMLGHLNLEADKNLYRYVHEDQRLRGRISIVGTATGRLAVSSPPLHGMAKVMRNCFVAPKGQTFLAMDVSGSEISWMAHYSQDEKLLELAFSGESLHDTVANGLGIPRPAAKALNFALGYGGGGPAVKKGMDANFWGQYTIEECASLAARRRGLFPGYQRWCRETEAFAHEHGYVVSEFGWVRRLPAAQGTNGAEYHEALRQAVNTPIQSASSDAVLLRAMEMEEQLGIEIVLLKHDEILALVPKRSVRKVAREMKKIMDNREWYWGRARIPLYVDFQAGESWGRMEEVKL